MNFTEFLHMADSFLWGGPLALLILLSGIYFTIKLKFLQVRKLKEALLSLLRKNDKGEGEISPFASLCTSLSATIGTGNIIGVAASISLGGPGALLWMLTAAFFGMATKYAEGFLAVKYRVTEKEKTKGGPFYYIELGMGKVFMPLSYFFAFSGLCTSLLGMGTLVQSNAIADAVGSFLKENNNTDFIKFGNVSFSSVTVVCAVFAATLSGFALVGGIKRISRIAELTVPFMALLYISLCFIIIAGHAEKIIPSIYLVVKSAFTPEAALGAASGITLREALRQGISGGVFSNEAGLGTSPIADASAKTDSPEKQGLVSMLSVFIDTFLICTLTSLAVLVTGSYKESGLTGGEIAEKTFETGFFKGGDVASLLFTLCVVLFSFSTIIGWSCYGEACLSYITKSDKRGIRVYRFLYTLAVFLGPFISVPTVWTLAKVMNAAMAIPNLIALFFLSRRIKS